MATYETLVDNTRLPRETAALLRTAGAMAGQPTREDSDVRQDIPAIRTSLWFWWRFWYYAARVGKPRDLT